MSFARFCCLLSGPEDGASVPCGRSAQGWMSAARQAFGEQLARSVFDGRGPGEAGQIDGLARPGQVESLVRLRGEDLRAQGVVADVAGAGEHLGQVPLGDAVLAAVVGHPAGRRSWVGSGPGRIRPRTDTASGL